MYNEWYVRYQDGKIAGPMELDEAQMRADRTGGAVLDGNVLTNEDDEDGEN